MTNIPKNYRRLDDSERHPSKDTVLLGPADENEIMTVTIVMRHRPDGPKMPEIAAFLKTSTINPHISRKDFGKKYGASEEDIQKVVNFVVTHNMKVVETNVERRTVIVSGTVAQMSNAFGSPLGKYERKIVNESNNRSQIERYRGRDGFIHIPEYLHGIIKGVFGLDNRNITKRNRVDPLNTKTISTQTITQLYNFPANSAAGQTIGIVSLDGYQTADINSTFSTGNPPTIVDVSVDGKTNSSNADGETTQDICIASLAAPGATIAVYFHDGSTQGWINMLKKIAHPDTNDPHCSVVSSSFYISDGDDENTLLNEEVSIGFINSVSESFHDIATITDNKITICIASGDTGSSSKVGGNPSQWGYHFAADKKAHVQYPAADPWVLSVGGTTIGNINGTTFDEYVWNDPSHSDSSNWGKTGGGVSDHFNLPSYQNGIDVPKSINDNHVGRGVPDVAANASYNSGYSGIIVGGGDRFIGNGTSASAPLWAGLIAVINAALGKNIGFVNPAIYHLGSSVFRDIVPRDGPADNSNSGVAGYPAKQGWDACTGWGSPNGVVLLEGLRNYYREPATDSSSNRLEEISQSTMKLQLI